MSFLLALKTYILSILIFFTLDYFWLSYFAKDFYIRYAKDILRTKDGGMDPIVLSAVLFYMFFIAGIIYFAVIPAIKENSLQRAMINGALYGFFTYMTFDLTNHALIKGFAWQLIIPDIIWGAFVSMTVAIGGYYIALY